VHDDAFEWNDAKAAQNLRDHGASFEMARDAFKDAFAIEWIDSGQHAREERYCLLGVVEDRLLFVPYTVRGDRFRIISARKAEPNERRRYHEESREA
jgi:hypothetical protein